MSRKGNCFDNGVIESFFGTLKIECHHLQTHDGIAALKAGDTITFTTTTTSASRSVCKDSVRWNTG